MSIKEQIRAAIERQVDEYKPIVGGVDEITGAHIVLAKLLSFLDSLPEQPASDGLEEAAEEYATKWHKRPDGSEWKSIFPKAAIRDFIAGAEWWKDKMLEEAKDGYVSAIIIHNDGDEEHYAVTYPNGERPHSITDKVKIIIL